EPVGDLIRDQILAVNLIDGNDVWLEFDGGRWVNFMSQGNRFLQIRGLTAVVTSAAATIRSQPDDDSDNLGVLATGEEISVTNIDGQDVWIEFEPGRWAPIVFRGIRFMELIR
ncbi:MAG: hypothetical protein R3335_15510, partial [Anaerolineales bacterium]|nr:hypothetical protein [Anaerolineales bacterium]